MHGSTNRHVTAVSCTRFPRTNISTSEAAIVPSASILHFAHDDGVETRLMVGGERVDAPPFATVAIAIPAGSAPPMHGHNWDEQVTILEGRAVTEVAGVQPETGPSDTSTFPHWMPRRFVSIGDGHLKILWIYAEAAVARTFMDAGETAPHLSQEDKVRPALWTDSVPSSTARTSATRAALSRAKDPSAFQSEFSNPTRTFPPRAAACARQAVSVEPKAQTIQSNVRSAFRAFSGAR